ncbi:MAG: tRNA (N6-isopentenyl adenosine(37)-C2)-methylthiotransferase MiaB [Defluviitaleaceae bacterium]|nr:tRNA (N6-isopentenyl adenosine(37)-C2)-methylthiotransferase MiaB [Defluviitaleaceae bacterium]
MSKIDKNKLAEQKKYITAVKELNQANKQVLGRQKTAYISTFGCQMNAHDSEILLGLLFEMGYAASENEKEADIIIYNTCCVRENAENRVYGNLGYLKKLKQERPDIKIVLCGCMMQQDTVISKIKESYRNVDLIFGTFNMHVLPELLYTCLTSGGMIIDVWESHDEFETETVAVRQHKYKASVNIMYGCNNFCSYCIVPYVRGRERSRRKADIINEVKELAADGVIEIMLLGQNVNSYGNDLVNGETFGGLLREINSIQGVKRIRFMTSHPKDLSDEVIYAIRDCDNICNHIHLPLQSGSSRVLELMNRKYSKDDYLYLADKIKKEIPGAAITTDIIVGFPSETEEDFLETLDVVKRVGYSTAYTFLYSKRTGTPAANMDEQVPEDVAKERFNRLLKMLNDGIYEINKQLVGETIEVFAEEVNEKDETLITGRAYNNTTVHFKGDSSLIGKILNIKVTDCKTFYLMGVIA